MEEQAQDIILEEEQKKETVEEPKTEPVPVPEEEKKHNKFITWIKEHPRAVFWIRVALWSIFACILPFAFIAWRFELFYPVSKVHIGGWGILAIVIVAVFIFSVVRYVRIAEGEKYSFAVQCLNGFCKVILPLLTLLVVLYSIRNNLNLFIQALGAVIICEAAAIPLNPLPKWAYDKQKDIKEGEIKSTIDYFIDKFFKGKKDDE